MKHQFLPPVMIPQTGASAVDEAIARIKEGLDLKPSFQLPNFTVEKITVEGKSRTINRNAEKKSAIIGGNLLRSDEGFLEVTPKIIDAITARARYDGALDERIKASSTISQLEKTASIGAAIIRVLPKSYNLTTEMGREEAAADAKELVRLGKELAILKSKIEGNPTLASEWERFQMFMKLAQDDKEDGN